MLGIKHVAAGFARVSYAALIFYFETKKRTSEVMLVIFIMLVENFRPFVTIKIGLLRSVNKWTKLKPNRKI